MKSKKKLKIENAKQIHQIILEAIQTTIKLHGPIGYNHIMMSATKRIYGNLKNFLHNEEQNNVHEKSLDDEWDTKSPLPDKVQEE